MFASKSGKPLGIEIRRYVVDRGERMRSDEMAQHLAWSFDVNGSHHGDGNFGSGQTRPCDVGRYGGCVFDTTGPAARHHRVPAVLGFQPT
jgi:hypothetical protein